MKTTDSIANTIDRLPNGYVFTYTDFVNEANKKEAVVKALNRMVAAGKLSKLSKGKYYKSEKTVFGDLQPNQREIVKDLLEVDRKIVGYLTGFSIYNQLGLTTQVSNTIEIGKNEIRPNFKRGKYNISFLRQKNTITKDTVPLLQILDAIRNIRKIPDTGISSACMRFKAILKELTEKDRSTLVRLSQKYPPATRALLGAIFEEIGDNSFSDLLQKSLNPITKYKLSGANKALSTTEKWNIV